MSERERIMCAGLLDLYRQWLEDGCPKGKAEPEAKALAGTATDSKGNDALRRAS